MPEHKQHETSQFCVKNIHLIDTTGEVDISVIANKEIEVRCFANQTILHLYLYQFLKLMVEVKRYSCLINT